MLNFDISCIILFFNNLIGQFFNLYIRKYIYKKIYLRFHIKHVFDSQAFPLFVLLLDQFIFGPGHVDPVGCSSRRFLTGEVRSRVSVMDQLGLNKEQPVRNAGLGHLVVWCDNATQYNMTRV